MKKRRKSEFSWESCGISYSDFNNFEPPIFDYPQPQGYLSEAEDSQHQELHSSSGTQGSDFTQADLSQQFTDQEDREFTSTFSPLYYIPPSYPDINHSQDSSQEQLVPNPIQFTQVGSGLYEEALTQKTLGLHPSEDQTDFQDLLWEIDVMTSPDNRYA